MVEWVNEKHDECKDPAKPAKLHKSNWRLTEQWIVIDQGQDCTSETKVDESMDRSSDALSTSLQMLMPGQEVGCGKTKSGEQRHKAMLTRLMSSIKKLGSCIAIAETQVPMLKRKIDEKEWIKVKKAMTILREKKDEWLDKCEDFKETPQDDDHALEVMLTEMAELQKQITEDSAILQEAMKKHQKIKNEPKAEEASMEQDGGGEKKHRQRQEGKTIKLDLFNFALTIKVS